MSIHLASKLLALLLVCSFVSAQPKIQVGLDLFLQEGRAEALKDKRVGLITNHTGRTSQLGCNVDLLREKLTLIALFCPEHGLHGSAEAGEKVQDAVWKGIPIYSLYGKQRRPTEKMMQSVDLLLYDIQDIGCRSYTYATTLFYAMEAAAAHGVKVVVLDRPNPMGGLLVEGPMLEQKMRSFLGYLNVPYCHGMTIGELARFFNEEYQIGCDLEVIAMKGWTRSMDFGDTGLHWIPTSPHMPEKDSPFFYATTGVIGELGLVSTGVGTPQPFKLIGAPWIQAERLARALNAQNIEGVHFLPFHFRPFYGMHKGVACQGVKILITDRARYHPQTVQHMILGILKSLYPKKFGLLLSKVSDEKRSSFCKVVGNEIMLRWIETETYIAWKMIEHDKAARDAFCKTREKYLLYPN